MMYLSVCCNQPARKLPCMMVPDTTPIPRIIFTAASARKRRRYEKGNLLSEILVDKVVFPYPVCLLVVTYCSLKVTTQNDCHIGDTVHNSLSSGRPPQH